MAPAKRHISEALCEIAHKIILTGTHLHKIHLWYTSDDATMPVVVTEIEYAAYLANSNHRLGKLVFVTLWIGINRSVTIPTDLCLGVQRSFQSPLP